MKSIRNPLIALLATQILFAGLFAGCAEDILNTRAPKLEASAYTDGQFYTSFDDETLTIDLGEVPVHAEKNAIFLLENPTQMPLMIREINAIDSTGRRWKDPTFRDPAPTTDEPPASAGSPWTVGVLSTRQLVLPYAPVEEGVHHITYEIVTNATNLVEGKILVHVLASAVYHGAPDIEVEYNAYVGPILDQDCVDVDGTGDIKCVIPPVNALDFGNIGLGTTGTARLIIRNRAECPPYEGVDICGLCQLTVDKDQGATAYNIGLGFKADTNTDERFSFAGSTATPFQIKQRNITECGETGEVRLLVNFVAPTEEGIFETTIIVESNDFDEPILEIPVIAHARNAPIAIAKLREFDANSPSSPYSDADDIEPLTRVYLDGRDSYDPTDPNDPTLIGSYLWEVLEFPAGTDPAMFDPSGASSDLFSFWLPLAGHYVVRLTVWNTDGIMSGDTESSRVEFDVIPGDRMHIQLVWDSPSNDQDLHMTYASHDDRVCNKPYDCHWLNKTPIWFTDAGEDDGPNPSLDIDDTNGLGPENINIDDPNPGTYRVYVHFWGDFNFTGSSSTIQTVRIWLNGVQRAEYRRTMSADKDIWAVGDITWNADGTGTVVPYPSDLAGQVGSIDHMEECSDPGWAFP